MSEKIVNVVNINKQNVNILLSRKQLDYKSPICGYAGIRSWSFTKMWQAIQNNMNW